MSADADRKGAHGHCEDVASELRDRIAQLTAELDKTRQVAFNTSLRESNLLGQLDVERAAHECTKAELADARKQLESAHTRLNDADGALQDAGTPVVEERFDEAIQRLHAQRDAAIAREQAAQAEAAEMREALEAWIGEHGEPHSGYTTETHWKPCPRNDSCDCELVSMINAALAGNAGRALASRVPLLEVVADAARKSVVRSEDGCVGFKMSAVGLVIDALAALDSKDT
jgi:hypothetical protein